ncbi:hypothetical protein BH10PSE17_BH10PSE17_14330 [soil metagenome]
MSAPHLMQRNASDRSFFAHHGVWAPGIRLFRLIGFRAKALIVSGCLMIPLVTVGTVWFMGVQANLQFTRDEQTGVDLVKHLMNVQLGAAQAALGEPGRTADLAAAMARAAHAQDASGNPFDTATQLINLTRLVRDDPARASADTAALITQVADRSNLTLDPDLDTYYLMDAGIGRIPLLIGLIADSVEPPRSEAPEAAALLTRPLKAAVLMDQAAADLATDIQKVQTLHSGIARELGLAEAVDAMSTLRTQVIHGSGAAQRAAAAGVALNQLGRLQEKTIQRLGDLLDERAQTMLQHRFWMAVLIGVSVTGAGYLFTSFYFVMRGGLTETTRHLEAITQGDLTTTPVPWGSDEAASLMLKLRDMQLSLRSIVSDVRAGSDEILGSTGEIATGAMDLATRTEASGVRLERTSSSIEQIAQTVKATAEHAHEAAGIARENAVAAADGGRVMQQVVDTMSGIGGSATRIGEIVGVIDGIAFQTNILALNAAVEAARAGDSGRGFAVVASEVRALAKRSADAAREIKELIANSVAQTTEGTRVVDAAQNTIHRVVESAKRVGILIEEIATGAREQSLGIDQVGRAAQELDSDRTLNAALVEETAAAAGSLRERAAALSERVARFNLPESKGLS